jgi:hypothetical protein
MLSRAAVVAKKLNLIIFKVLIEPIFQAQGFHTLLYTTSLISPLTSPIPEIV